MNMKMEKEIRKEMKRLGLEREEQLVAVLSNIPKYLAKGFDDSSLDAIMMMKLDTYNKLSTKNVMEFNRAMSELKEGLKKKGIEFRLYLTEDVNFDRVKKSAKSDIITSIDKL